MVVFATAEWVGIREVASTVLVVVNIEPSAKVGKTIVVEARTVGLKQSVYLSLSCPASFTVKIQVGLRVGSWARSIALVYLAFSKETI